MTEVHHSRPILRTVIKILTRTKLTLAGQINSSHSNEILYYKIYTSHEELCHSHSYLFSSTGNNMPCVVSEARGGIVPLKISRFFEHRQNNTSDITSLSLPLLVLASFKNNFFLSIYHFHWLSFVIPFYYKSWVLVYYLTA